MSTLDKLRESKKLMKKYSSNSSSEYFSSLNDSLKTLEDLYSEVNESCCEKGTKEAQICAILLYQGGIHIEKEDLNSGEKILQDCLQIVNNYHDDLRFAVVNVLVLNHLGLIWSQRGDLEKAKLHFNDAELIYYNLKKNGVKSIDIEDLFVDKNQWNFDQGNKKLEEAHTLTLFYFAQIYKMTQDILKSAIYCHATLEKQLETGNYEQIDWALSAVTLSQCLLENNLFTEARHHLAAGSFMIQKFKESIKIEEESNLETYKYRQADIARCWIRYGLLLMEYSKQRLMTDEDIPLNTPAELTKNIQKEFPPYYPEQFFDLKFQSLSLETYENQVPDKPALIFEDAKVLFNSVLSWLDDAKSYYSLDRFASDWAQLMQDHSKLYEALMFFESDTSNQCKMHKRRLDLLEQIIEKLNPKYYADIHKGVLFEIGETYMKMAQLKKEILAVKKEPDPNALGKINKLVSKGISTFTNFFALFKQKDNERVPEEFEIKYLRGLVHVATLYSMYIYVDKETKDKSREKSLEAYAKLNQYCSTHNIDFNNSG